MAQIYKSMIKFKESMIQINHFMMEIIDLMIKINKSRILLY